MTRMYAVEITEKEAIERLAAGDFVYVEPLGEWQRLTGQEPLRVLSYAPAIKKCTAVGSSVPFVPAQFYKQEFA